MSQPLVMGVILRLDLMGWQGDPPGLPDPPIRIAPGEAGSVSYYYDYSPPNVEQDVPEFCLRLMGRLRRALLPPCSPFSEQALAMRVVLGAPDSETRMMVLDGVTALDVDASGVAAPVAFVVEVASAENVPRTTL